MENDQLANRRYFDSLHLRTEHDLKEFFKKYPPETLLPENWTRLTASGLLSNVKMINKYYDYLDWEMLPCIQQIPEDILEKYSGYLNWACVSLFQKLSWEFIKKYKQYLSLDLLLHNSKLQDADYYEKIFKLHEKFKDNPEYQARWKKNRENFFLLKRNYRKNKEENEEKPTVEQQESTIKSKKEKSSTVSGSNENLEGTAVKDETKKRTRLTEKKVNQMNKAQLKEELAKRGVKTLYHDTLDILRGKLIGTFKKEKRDDSSK